MAATNDSEVPSTHQPADGGVYTDDSQNDGKKVFIGNIAYTATPEDVQGFISSAGGKVVSIDLPKRFGSRPSGFAFVVYSTEEEAKAAVEGLNGKKLGDRDIGVQMAKTFAESEAARTDKRAARKEAIKERKRQVKVGGGAQGDADENVAPEAAAESVPEADAGESGAAKKPRKKKARKPARRLPEEGEDAPADEAPAAAGVPLGEINVNATDAPSTKPKRAKRTRKPAGAAAAGALDGSSAPQANDEAAEEARIDKELQGGENVDPEEGGKGRRGEKREPRQPREPKWIQTDVPSPTTIFVANLPFTVDDAALSELFTSLDIDVKSASVVRKPRFSQKILPRSKGFGFVEVANEAAQKTALEKLAGHKIGDRELTIKVANTREPINAEGEAEGEAVEASA